MCFASGRMTDDGARASIGSSSPAPLARRMAFSRAQWGLAGLLAFEAIVAAYTFGNSLTQFSLMYALGTIVLALAIWRGPERWHYAVLAAASLYRAYLQTASGAPLGVYPTYLVPLGFAWLAIAPEAMPSFAIGSVALARTWFIVWYFLPGNTILVVANALGAAGAWLWASAQMTEGNAGPAAAPQA